MASRQGLPGLEHLGDKRPESNLGRENPLAAVVSTLFQIKELLAEEVAGEIAEVFQGTRALEPGDDAPGGSTEKQRAEGLEKGSGGS